MEKRRSPGAPSVSAAAATAAIPPATIAARRTSSAGNAAPKGKMVCRMEYFVGSNIPDRVCRYQPAPGELGDGRITLDAEVLLQTAVDAPDQDFVVAGHETQ